MGDEARREVRFENVIVRATDEGGETIQSLIIEEVSSYQEEEEDNNLTALSADHSVVSEVKTEDDFRACDQSVGGLEMPPEQA